MQINKIYVYSPYSAYNASGKNYQPKNKKQNVSCETNCYNIPFARVDKGMSRFYEVNKHRLPTTVKDFLNTVQDKLAFSPLEAHKRAYEKLNTATTIDEIQKIFPNEELFIYLNDMSNTQATNGLLGIYREFKELYPNGVLKTGECLTVYLVKKLFGEAKLIQEVNEDLENDLDDDIKSAFKSKYPGSDYVVSSTLRALGIYTPNRDYINSLKFTRDGYSDTFGLKISEAQLKYWNSLTEEQKFEILSKRLEGRDNWWNSLPYNDKLELAAGIDSDEDLYAKYKAYVKAKKRELKKESSVQTVPSTLERPKKKVKVGSRLEDKDVFVLWFKKNIEKFYAGLSERDKDSVHIKRSRRLTQRWFEMSPEEKTELINKMKSGREPARFVMIDAWNHSYELIKELSKFLQAQQIFKPVDVLYSSEEFSEFQSKVMTEFWANHRDLAKEFGKSIIKAQARVEDAISHGQFEDLKREIMRNRADRIKQLDREKRLEAMNLKNAEQQRAGESRIKPVQTTDYKLDFKEAYKKNFDPNNYFPQSYVDEMTDSFLHVMSEDTVKKYTEELNSPSAVLSEEMAKFLYEIEKEIGKLPRVYRINNALSVALANELVSKGFNSKVFEKDVNELVNIINMYNSDCNDKKQQIDKKRIERLYNEYLKDLTKNELAYITHHYFCANGDDIETQEKFVEYMHLFGKSLLIVYSDKSAYSDEVKQAINNKFLRGALSVTNNSIEPLVKTIDDIRYDKEIASVKFQIAKRFSYLPAEIMEIYNNELGLLLRMEKDMKDGLSIDEIRNSLGKKTTRLENDAPYVSITKNNMEDDNKLKMLAIEQAIADEIAKITHSDVMYASTFEELAIWVERLSMITPGKSTLALDKNNPDAKIVLKNKPNIQRIRAKYKEYYRNIKERDDLYKENGEINTDAIIFALNPDENMLERDELIEKRMEAYFGDNNKSLRHLKDTP